MANSRRNTPRKSFCFRGIRFRISCEDLPEAIQQSRRFHADLVDELVTQAREHARLLARRSELRNRAR